MTNTRKKQDLTYGPLWSQILVFSLPLILSNLLQVLFNLADIAVVGQFAGAMALGSVGSTSILIATFNGFLIGVSGGINVLTARYFGAKDRDRLQTTVHSAAIISLLLGMLLLLLGVFFGEAILLLLGTKEELLDGAVLYLRIYVLGMPAMALYNFGNAVFSAVGDTQRSLRYLTISGILNVILNLFFVIVCHMDVAGVALASILSQYLSAVLVVLALFRVNGSYALRRKQLRLHKASALELLAIGIPGGLQNCIFGLANLFIQSAVNTFDAIMVSGNSAASNADSIIHNVMAAFYTACGSFMGQNYGARKKERILKSFCISMAYSFGIGAGLGLLVLIFGEEFLHLFTSEAAVVEAGMKRLSIMALSYGISAFMDCTIAACRALGKSLMPSIIVILGSCVFRIIWVNTIFAHFRTIPSLYLLYSISWTLTGMAEIAYFIHTYRQTTKILNAPLDSPPAS